MGFIVSDILTHAGRSCKRRPYTLWLVVLLCLLNAPQAQACSVCQVGDYTVTLFGSEKNYTGRWRLAVQGLHRGETQGTAGVDQRKIKEDRLELSTSIGINDRISLFTQLPLVRKTLNDTNGASETADGIGDLQLGLRYVIPPRQIAQSWIYGVQLGIKLPTGQSIEKGGQSLDIDVQPGNGATVPRLGIFAGHFAYPWMGYATAGWSPEAEGDQGFEAAEHVVITVNAQYALSPMVNLQTGIETRWAGFNRYNNEIDPNSGGTVAYLTPGITLRLGQELLLNLAVQLPLYEDLNGSQSEDGEIRIGLTYDLPTPAFLEPENDIHAGH